MPNIYDQHRKAFSNVSAYCIMRGGERVATIAFRFPKDGAGRLWCYLHWISWPMVRGYAGGYGYDKCSAALASAQRHMMVPKEASQELRNHMMADQDLPAFLCAIGKDDGNGWERNLRNAGFDVLEAV